MTAPRIIDPAGMPGELLSQASPDLMRTLLQSVINALLSAHADTMYGAQWAQQDPEHQPQRNGYRHQPLDTRVGTIDMAIPKLRSGTYGVAISNNFCYLRQFPTVRPVPVHAPWAQVEALASVKGDLEAASKAMGALSVAASDDAEATEAVASGEQPPTVRERAADAGQLADSFLDEFRRYADNPTPGHPFEQLNEQLEQAVRDYEEHPDAAYTLDEVKASLGLD